MRQIKILLSTVLCIVALAACGKKTAPADRSEYDENIGHNPAVTQAQTVTETVTVTGTPTADLYISEIMADNKGLYLGTDADWIEIGNREERVVSLNGYYLSDNPEKPNAFPLAGNVIAENGYAVVLLSEEAPFHLNGDGETVYLFYGGEVIDSLTYTKEIGDRSASSDGVLSFATPGYPNTSEGYEAYSANVTLPELMFSEAMSSNTKFAAPDGQCYDFVELYNRTDHAVSLKGYALSDKRSELNRYPLPDVTLGAGEYYVVYCSGLTADGHAPFKISSSGETLYLSDGGTLTDILKIPADLEPDKSYGRNDNRLVYMEEATPGAANVTGYAARVAIPAVNVTPGLYADPVTVTLSGEGTIYYTLDGTRPSERSAVYEGPITVDTVKTIRAFAVKDGRVSEIGEYTYLIGISHTLPVVYVSIPNGSLHGGEGILDNKTRTIEKECVVTLYEDGEIKFAVPCGFRLHGNDSRNGAKQNFQLRFRSEYGPGKLKYKLFDDLDIASFDSLLLKGGSEDYIAAVMRDELCTGMVYGKTHLYVQDCKPCILYLDDRYWGVYYIRERFSDEYVADHFAVDKDSVDLLYSFNNLAQNGSSKDFNALISYVRNHDLTVTENYNYVMERIDAFSLMDWYICRSYVGDKDFNNIRVFRSTEYDSRWRWMYYDLDWAFYLTNDSPISGFIKNDDHNILIYKLLKNSEFQDAFLRRYASLMDSILNEEYITDEIDRFVAMLEPEMEQDRARWGYTMNGWRSSVQQIYNYVKDGARTKHVLKDIKNYFGLSDEQMKTYFGEHWTQ